MSGVQLKAVQDLQAQLTKVMEELDHKVFRPQQKAAFQCSIKCTDLRGPQEEMHACLAVRRAHPGTGRGHGGAPGVSAQGRGAVPGYRRTQDQGKFDKMRGECAVFYQKELPSAAADEETVIIDRREGDWEVKYDGCTA